VSSFLCWCLSLANDLTNFFFHWLFYRYRVTFLSSRISTTVWDCYGAQHTDFYALRIALLKSTIRLFQVNKGHFRVTSSSIHAHQRLCSQHVYIFHLKTASIWWIVDGHGEGDPAESTSTINLWIDWMGQSHGQTRIAVSWSTPEPVGFQFLPYLEDFLMSYLWKWTRPNFSFRQINLPSLTGCSYTPEHNFNLRTP